VLSGVSQLEKFELVTSDGATVRLTPQGEAAAHSLI
jgi:superfamily II helicase